MAQVGDVISISQGQALPSHPPGTHWVLLGSVVGDLGFVSEYKLVADAPGFGDLEDQFILGSKIPPPGSTTGGTVAIARKPNTTLFLFTSTAGTSTWSAPVDITIVQVVNLSGSVQWILGLDSTTWTNTFVNAQSGKVGVVVASYLTQIDLYFKVKKDQKLWFINNSNTNAAILVVFEYD